MRNLKVISAILIITNLAACRSTNVAVIEPQVEMPEVAGRTFDVGARAAVIPARSVRIAREPSVRPPDFRVRTEDTGQAVLSLGAETGLGERFEVGAFGGVGSPDSGGCGGISGKYQAYGPTRAQAVAGDWSIGVAAHATACQARTDGDSAGFLGDGGLPWSDLSTSRTFDVGASVGYHLAELFTIYGGFAIATTHAESEVNQDRSGDRTVAGGVYKAHLNGEAQSVALGANWGGRRTWFNLKLNYAHSNSDQSNPDHIGAGANLGVQF